MENYERDDIFFEAVNKNRQIVVEDEQTRNNISWNVNSYSKQISQAQARTRMIETRRKSIERKNAIKRMAVAGAILATLAGGLTVAVVNGDEISTSISEQRDFDDAIKILSRNVNMVLSARGLTNGFYGRGNSVRDYKNLNVTTIKEVYVYKYESALSGLGEKSKAEFDKFIRSVSYYDTDGKICFYDSFDDFLKINGFGNENDFKKKAKEIILDEYRNGKIVELLYEGISTMNRPIGKGK